MEDTTLAWHILASSYFDFDAIDRDADADRVPRHFLRHLAGELDAPIHCPTAPGETAAVSLADRLAGSIYADSSMWSMARRARKELQPGDGVYAAGSTSGIPLALLCSLFGPRRIKFAIAVTDVQRPKIRLFGWLLALLRTRWMMIVPHSAMVDVAARGFGRFVGGIMAINGLTDFDFFRPADPDHDAIKGTSTDKPTRPLIASCGTEARDYQLLADAVADLDADVNVKVCFASPNLTDKTRFTVPDPLPDNMEIRYFSFADLRALYQDSDVVVVPLLPNRYAAGMTTVFEAVACSRPVVVARSPGVIDELIDHDLVEWYEMGDREGLRLAIERVLADPVAAEARADKAHAWVQTHYSATAYLERVFQALELAFGDESPARTGDRPTPTP